MDCFDCEFEEEDDMLMGVHDRAHSPKVCAKPKYRKCPKGYGSNFLRGMTDSIPPQRIVDEQLLDLEKIQKV